MFVRAPDRDRTARSSTAGYLAAMLATTGDVEQFDVVQHALAVAYFLGATIFVTRPTLVSPAYRLSCSSIAQ